MNKNDTGAFFDRYSKNITEPFAIKTIGLSFDKKYLDYYHPADTNDFDFVSPDNDAAVEVTTVFTKNEKEVYEYEKSMANGKTNLKTSMIKDAMFNEDGSLHSYCGGCMGEIKKAIQDAVQTKNEKAKKRLKERPLKSVDLCVCIVDGSLFDLCSFELAFDKLDSTVFSNIFFITPARFICYSKEKNGFTEYARIIE